MRLQLAMPAARGLVYRFRYRARNSVGWGPYSEVSSLLAAEPPAAPPVPIHVSSTGSSITLQLSESENDGGSRVSSYELWMSHDYKAASVTFSRVAGYTDMGALYTLTVATDGIVSGETYALRTVAVNSKGPSAPSRELVVSVAMPIAKPNPPTRNLAKSTRDSLTIEWQQSSPTQIEVQGYMLYMGLGLAGNFELVYNGSSNPLLRTYVATGLQVGALY